MNILDLPDEILTNIIFNAGPVAAQVCCKFRALSNDKSNIDRLLIHNAICFKRVYFNSISECKRIQLIQQFPDIDFETFLKLIQPKDKPANVKKYPLSVNNYPLTRYPYSTKLKCFNHLERMIYHLGSMCHYPPQRIEVFPHAIQDIVRMRRAFWINLGRDVLRKKRKFDEI